MPVTVVQTATNTTTTNIPGGDFGPGTRAMLQITTTFPAPISSGNTILVAFVGDIISPGVNLTSGPNPSITSTTGGGLPDTTYYVQATYVDSSGNETAAGPEQSLFVAAGHLLVVSAPNNPNFSGGGVPGAVGWNVYVGTASGAEVKQNGSPLSFTTNYTEPTGGISTSGGTSSTSPLRDSLGLSYTRAVWVDGGLAGSQFGTHALGFFYASATTSGSEAITISAFGYNQNPFFGVDAYLSLMAVEVSGFTGPIVQGSAYVQQANSTGILAASVTDSTAVSRTTSFGSIAESSIAVIDLVAAGTDEFFAIGGSQGTLPLPTITGGVYQQLASTSITSGMHAWLWTAGPDIVPEPCEGGYQRGNIDWDQVGLDARHGDCHGILIQYSDGTHSTGALAMFLEDGTLTASGISGTGGGTGTGTDPIVVNGTASILVNGVNTSFDDTVLVNGA